MLQIIKRPAHLLVLARQIDFRRILSGDDNRFAANPIKGGLAMRFQHLGCSGLLVVEKWYAAAVSPHPPQAAGMLNEG